MVGLKGQVRATYEGMRVEIIESMSLVEALIDFGEDEGISETVFDRGESVPLRVESTSNEQLQPRPRSSLCEIQSVDFWTTVEGVRSFALGYN